MIKEKKIVIAIDGPSASGKGTLCAGLAKQLKYDFMDTGALYRLVAREVIDQGLDDSNVDQVISIANNVRDDFKLVQLVSEELRTDEVSIMTSKISAIPKVREILKDIQVNFADNSNKDGVILDGRDIGTVICPSADVKLFITATMETRASRRTKELQSKGIEIEYDEVFNEMEKRDERDINRKISPTKPADDAYVVNTSQLDQEGVLKLVLSIVGKKINN